VVSTRVRTLTQRELNRALLARQLLLERSPLGTPRVLEKMAGLQAQYAPAMYVGLWSRMDGLERADLTQALERRQVVQGTLLRSTIHLVSARDYWPFALGIREHRRAWYLRVSRGGLTDGEMAAAAERLRTALAGGTMRRTEVDKLLGPRHRAAAGLWVDLVRVPPSGTWERRRADLYGLAEEWLGPPTVSPEDGVDLLVRRYLGGFGPATRAELADWAGLPVAALGPALDRLEPRRFRAEDGAELLDLPRAPRPEAGAPAPVRFLPVWDATLLVHARRAGILPERFRSRVFSTKTPQSVNTFLVDGAVAGTWRYEDGRIRLDEFAPIPARARRELTEEAERLAAFHA
jgi:Winged helix DNA-binding domain